MDERSLIINDLIHGLRSDFTRLQSQLISLSNKVLFPTSSNDVLIRELRSDITRLHRQVMSLSDMNMKKDQGLDIFLLRYHNINVSEEYSLEKEMEMKPYIRELYQMTRINMATKNITTTIDHHISLVLEGIEEKHYTKVVENCIAINMNQEFINDCIEKMNE